jgi:4-aminobutyrate aminotransferase
VTPDILVLAKALSGGMPLGAIVANRELHEKWPTGGHGSTFGGNPVSCAAALANIEVIEEEKLVERSALLGAEIVERLQKSVGHLPGIVEVRGVGMMIGIETKALESGLLIMNCGVSGQTIRLMLPLNIQEDVLDKGLTILEEVISETIAES